MSRIQLYRDAQVADKAFTEELARLFGRDASLARYQPRGAGEEGSELRRLSDAKTAADKAWAAS